MRKRNLLTAFALMFALSLPMLASEFKVNLKTTLTGRLFNGETTKARSEFEMESSSKKLAFEIGNVNLPDNTVISVWINTSQIGSITIRNHGGTLLKSTYAGQGVPNVSVGTTVRAAYNGNTLASGKF